MSREISEAIAAVLVGVAILWLVAQPMLAPQPEAPDLLDLPEPEETARGRALLALRELEFDRATGKLSDADYAMLHARFAAAAVQVLDAEAGTAPTAAAPGGPNCPACGAARREGTRFCEWCGVAVSAGTPSQTTPLSASLPS
jgi:hypothetical protein